MGLGLVAVSGCRVSVCQEKLETHVVFTCHVLSGCGGWKTKLTGFILRICVVVCLTFMPLNMSNAP